MNKPLQIYPTDEEHKKLDTIQKILEKKTKSGTVRYLINLFYNVFKKFNQ